jgi:hypothetical protein
VCNFEIVENLKEYDPNADKFLISDSILLNTFSSVRLLLDFIVNNQDLISAKTKSPETVIVIKFSKVKDIL